MSDNVFRPRKINPSDIQQQEPAQSPTPQNMDFDKMAEIHKAAGMDNIGDRELASDMERPQFQGLSPEIMKAMQQNAPREERPVPNRGPTQRPIRNNEVMANSTKSFIDEMRPYTETYESITLPSLGKFYNGNDGPTNGMLNIRPMTGAEEKILATPRFVKKGQVVNMIFKNCMMEKYNPEDLLTLDRTYLLIYLRGISYSPDYEVQIRCNDCQTNFNTTINLDTLYNDYCPDDFDQESLVDVLPVTGYKITYRLSTGRDETLISERKERRVRMWGDNADDDTLLFRASLLIEHLENSKGEILSGQGNILSILEKLHIRDVAYIRNLLSNPPFGVDTKISLVCPSCAHEFIAELPLESNFFFPVTKKKRVERV
jgi:hypothetical protein